MFHRKKYIFPLLFAFFIKANLYLYSQGIINNGGIIHSHSESFIYVNGNLNNLNNGLTNIDRLGSIPSVLYVSGDIINDAQISADGNIRLLGNFIDNNIFNGGIGTVFLEGGNQNLGGTSVTLFHNLSLQGTGVKILEQDKQCNGILNLNDRELSTQTYKFFVLNTSTNAVQRTTGFVSSLNGGFLSRNTNSNQDYLFPVGSTVGNFRYRPVEIRPVNNNSNTYTVRLANTNATTESFNINQVSSEICEINPLFYHQINRTSGSSPADITIYYDQVADGDWDGIANWSSLASEWKVIINSVTIADLPMNRAIVNNWNNFSDIPYALHKSSVPITFNDFGPFCKGSPSYTLPTTSNEGIPGTWTPATVNTANIGIQTYTFTPNPPIACAFPYIIQIEVIDCCNLNIAASVTNANCYGENGTIIFTIENGFPPVNVTINGNPAASPFTGQAGLYTISAIDDYGCIANYSVNITQPPQLNVTTSYNPILCYGEATTVLVLPSGGTPPYTGAGSFPVGAGTHSFTVTDFNGCNNTVSISISQPDPLQLLLTSAPAQCGNTGGTVFSNVFGGTPAYSYTWSNGTSYNYISNLDPGTYSVTVRDNNNCTVSANATVGLTGFLSPAVSEISTIRCPGDATGALQVNIPNAVNPVSYVWNNGVTTSYNSNLTADTYTITVTDGWGCNGFASYTLVEPESISISPVLTMPSCFGFSDGNINIVVNGGNSPYNYYWNNGNNSETISNLAAGSYSVTVSDLNNCTISTSFNLNEPEELQLDYISRNISCNGFNDGSISLAASGGTLPYSYTLVHPQFTATGQNHLYLVPGVYNAYVRDINGCEVQQQIPISEPYPLSASATVSNPTCIGNNDGEIEISVIGGTYPYLYTFEQGSTDFHTITGLSEGIYNVTVTDANGCTYEVRTLALTDHQVDCLRIPNAFTPNEDGINDTWIIENIELFPRAIISVYNRWGQLLWSGRPGEEWNGKYKDKLVPTGSYLYVIELYNGSKPYSGIVTVIY